MLRADSAFYGRDVIAAARRAGARFSITARKDRAVTAAISAIPDDAWTTIRYPKAVFDEQLGQWVSDAEVAEISFTAFASRAQGRTGHRPVDRPPGPGRQPRPRRRERAGRIVPGLAAPRRVHRLTAADAAPRRPTTAGTRSSNRSSPT